MQGLLKIRIQPEQQLLHFQQDTILVENGIISPLGPSKPGVLNKFTLLLSTLHMDNYVFYIHYHNHFTSSQLKTYGSEVLKVNVKDKGSFRTSYEVEPTEVVFLDQEKDPCINAEDNERSDIVNIWPCLEDYIASKLNCTLPWLSEKPPLCTNHLGYLQYVEEFVKVMNFETDNFTQTANCIPSCKRVEYSLKHFSTLPDLEPHMYQYLGVDNAFQNKPLQIDFFFGKDRFTKREQYYTYDFQNLTADFGGYLGLLLGYSLLGFYDAITGQLQKVLDKCNKRKSMK